MTKNPTHTVIRETNMWLDYFQQQVPPDSPSLVYCSLLSNSYFKNGNPLYISVIRTHAGDNNLTIRQHNIGLKVESATQRKIL